MLASASRDDCSGALKLPKATRVTDKVNIPELQNRLERRIDLIIETARDLSKLRASNIEA
jgi:hypothetical protein